MEPFNIYYTVTNGGDGSYGVEFFFQPECIELLQEELPEHYPSESDGQFMVTGGISGFHINTPADTQQILKEYAWDSLEDDLLCPLQ